MRFLNRTVEPRIPAAIAVFFACSVAPNLRTWLRSDPDNVAVYLEHPVRHRVTGRLHEIRPAGSHAGLCVCLSPYLRVRTGMESFVIRTWASSFRNSTAAKIHRFNDQHVFTKRDSGDDRMLATIFEPLVPPLAAVAGPTRLVLPVRVVLR